MARAARPARAAARAACALLALCVLLPRARAGAPTMWLQNVTDIDPLAVCNDGSPAGYYFVQGTTQSNVWLVYLEGGMWCYDQTSCDYRFKNALYSMSSTTWKDQFRQGGIFETNPTKSPIAGANKAFVTYCSSDAWVGDGESYGYQFRGQRIVSAVLGSLVAKQGMGTAPDTRLIFGGCSAGGRGAAFNIDYVGDILSAAGAPGVSVYGLMDAALWIDIPPAVPGIISQQCQTAALAVMANATARMGDACLAAYPGDESWKCLYGQYRMPFIQTPYILQASQLDTFQIEININAAGDMLPPTTPAQFAFASRFQAAMKTAIAGLPTASQTGSGIFSPACFHHCVTDAAGFWNIHIGAQSFKDVFTAWFIHGVAPQHVADSCTGWRCGTCSTKRSHKGGKLKPGHGATSPAAILAAQVAAGNLTALAPPAPGHPDPWGWSAASQAAADPLPAVCVAAGLTPATAPMAAPTGAPALPPGVAAPAERAAAAAATARFAPAPPPGASLPRSVGGVSTLRSAGGEHTVSPGASVARVLVVGAAMATVPVGAVLVWRRVLTNKPRVDASLEERRSLL